jgi:hypothetical protein
MAPAKASAICALLIAAGPLWGGVNIRLIRGRPVVDGVYVNRHGPYRFLIDTATTSNHIEAALAKSIGLKATFRSELTSSLGIIQVSGSDGVEVAMGSLRADQQSFLFAGMEVVHQLAPDIQGILGQEFLSRFDYLLDLRARRLEFGSPQPGSAGTQVPFRNLHGRPVVPTSLGELALDSGADWIILFGVAGNYTGRRMITMSGSADVGMVFSALRIEGHTFWHGDAVAIPAATEADVAGLLPISLFRAVYISNSQGYVIFQ